MYSVLKISNRYLYPYRNKKLCSAALAINEKMLTTSGFFFVFFQIFYTPPTIFILAPLINECSLVKTTTYFISAVILITSQHIVVNWILLRNSAIGYTLHDPNDHLENRSLLNVRTAVSYLVKKDFQFILLVLIHYPKFHFIRFLKKIYMYIKILRRDKMRFVTNGFFF